MITVHQKEEKEHHQLANPGELKKFNPSEVVWIDLLDPSPEERNVVEKFCNVKLLSYEQSQEIESTSRFSETPGRIISNSNFFVAHGDTFIIAPSSFILNRDGILISTHKVRFESFLETDRRLAQSPSKSESGYDVFLTVLESRIDHDADTVELVARHISDLSKEILSGDEIDKEILHRIISLQNSTMALRENIFDLLRILSGIRRSKKFPEDAPTRVELMIKDVNSLVNHVDFSFQRLDYMQDTALGLINIQQNEIVKIFSVAAVIFMPPTLIASIYGMNFKYMPELNWAWHLSNGWIVPLGYIFALVLMAIFTILTFLYFRYKKWL